MPHDDITRQDLPILCPSHRIGDWSVRVKSMNSEVRRALDPTLCGALIGPLTDDEICGATCAEMLQFFWSPAHAWSSDEVASFSVTPETNRRQIVVTYVEPLSIMACISSVEVKTANTTWGRTVIWVYGLLVEVSKVPVSRVS